MTFGDGGSLPEPLSLYEGDGTSLHRLQVDPPQCLLSAIDSTLPVSTRVFKSLLGTVLPRNGDLQLWWLPSSKQDGQCISSSENHFQGLLVSGKGCLHYSVASCAMAICYKSVQPRGMTWDSLKTDGKTDLGACPQLFPCEAGDGALEVSIHWVNNCAGARGSRHLPPKLRKAKAGEC